MALCVACPVHVWLADDSCDPPAIAEIAIAEINGARGDSAIVRLVESAVRDADGPPYINVPNRDVIPEVVVVLDDDLVEMAAAVVVRTVPVTQGAPAHIRVVGGPGDPSW